jgi:hypothetical protein
MNRKTRLRRFATILHRFHVFDPGDVEEVVLMDLLDD